MAEAIFGLVGVVLGGLIASGFEAFKLRRATRLERQASTRLVLAEIIHNSSLCSTIREGVNAGGDQRIIALSQLVDLDDDAWTRHRATLAGLLDWNQWHAVSVSYVLLNGIMKLPPPPVDMGQAEVDLLDEHLTHAEHHAIVAQAALKPHLGRPKTAIELDTTGLSLMGR